MIGYLTHLKLTELKTRDGFLGIYSEGLSYFYRSGIFEFLRRKAQPELMYRAEEASLESARAAGYAEALDDIMYFREKYLEAPSEESRKAPDFGAIDVLERQGNISKKEADAIRRGTKPEYASAVPANNTAKPN